MHTEDANTSVCTPGEERRLMELLHSPWEAVDAVENPQAGLQYVINAIDAIQCVGVLDIS